jgi:hypothetical protein
MVAITAQHRRIIHRLLMPEFRYDPLTFVQWAFPWGKTGTPLAHHDGPRKWQREILISIRDHFNEQIKRNLHPELGPLETYLGAVSSGRGIGKTAFECWLAWWFFSTRLGSSVIFSANTEDQLKKVAWGEMGKWHALFIAGEFFDMSATSVTPTKEFEFCVRQELKIGTEYYYIAQKLWSEENPDAYAGTHNHNGTLLIFDEAAGIPKPIWTVAEGFFTEPVVDRMWMAFSNPRRPDGAFFECFHGARDSWRTWQIDSRDVEGTDKGTYERIIKQHGEDSDEARVEVKGQFPSQGEDAFISRGVVQEARKRGLIQDSHAALIMGVDVARYGNDASCVAFRRGRDARTVKARYFKGLDNMQLAYKVSELIDRYKPDAVCIDAGNGTGVIDRLREMGYRVHEIWFGSKSDEPEYGNKRAMMWGRMKEWLNGACLEDSDRLETDLVGPKKVFSRNGDAIMLESKEDMRKRGLASPDHGDALALTHAVRVSRRDSPTYRNKNDLKYPNLGLR